MTLKALIPCILSIGSAFVFFLSLCVFVTCVFVSVCIPPFHQYVIWLGVNQTCVVYVVLYILSSFELFLLNTSYLVSYLFLELYLYRYINMLFLLCFLFLFFFFFLFPFYSIFIYYSFIYIIFIIIIRYCFFCLFSYFCYIAIYIFPLSSFFLLFFIN